MVRKTHLIKLLNAIFFACAFSSCGQLTTTVVSSFKLRMLGVYTVPPGATGTEAPRSHTYSFKSLKLYKTDGTEVALYEDTAKVFKVIDRPQLLFANYDMSDYDSVAFSKASVEFDTTVVVATKNDQESTITLDTAVLDLNEAFTISKSQSQTLTVKVAWGRTITEVDGGTDTASTPTFDMVYDDE